MEVAHGQVRGFAPGVPGRLVLATCVTWQAYGRVTTQHPACSRRQAGAFCDRPSLLPRSQTSNSILDSPVKMLLKLAPLGMLALGALASKEFTPVDMLSAPRPQPPIVAPGGKGAISVVDQWEEKSNK